MRPRVCYPNAIREAGHPAEVLPGQLVGNVRAGARGAAEVRGNRPMLLLPGEGARWAGNPKPSSKTSSSSWSTPIWRPPAVGSVLTIYTKGAIASYWRASWPLCGGGVGQAGGCAARRQGKGLDARPCRGAGGCRWGASKAPREAWPARRSSPTGGAPGLGAAGSEIGALPWGTPRALVDREDSISIGWWAA